MAVSKSNKNKSYISVPSQIIASISHSSLDSLLQPPKKKLPPCSRLRVLCRSSRFFILLISVLGFLWMVKMLLNFDPSAPFSQNPCSSISQDTPPISGEVAEIDGGGDEFWKQPDGMGYRPCLDFSDRYRKESAEILKDRTRYLMVVVAGGMNQQRNQIVDAVVIARILGAALVVPILQKNVIWGDERFVFLSQILRFVIVFSYVFLLNLCDCFGTFAVNLLIYLIWITSRACWEMM